MAIFQPANSPCELILEEFLNRTSNSPRFPPLCCQPLSGIMGASSPETYPTLAAKAVSPQREDTAGLSKGWKSHHCPWKKALLRSYFLGETLHSGYLSIPIALLDACVGSKPLKMQLGNILCMWIVTVYIWEARFFSLGGVHALWFMYIYIQDRDQ